MLRTRSGCLQSTFCRLKETVTLTQVTRFVKRVRVRRARQLSVARADGFFGRREFIPKMRGALDASVETPLPVAFEVNRAGFSR